MRFSSFIELLVTSFTAIIVIYNIKRAIHTTQKIEEGKKYSLFSLFKYAILIFSIANSFQVQDFDISTILAGSAALLVGLGIDLQTLFKNFVSGIILLFDASIKVGDVIEINEVVCKIQEITLLITTAITRGNKIIILPNAILTSNQIQNWTYNGNISRFEVKANVDYDTDINQVKTILLGLINQNESVLDNPKPFVRFTNFGNSTLFFSVFFLD